MDRDDLHGLQDAFLALDADQRQAFRNLIDYQEQQAEVRTTPDEELLWTVTKQVAPVGSRHYRSLSEFLRDKRHGLNRVEYGDAVRSVFDLLAEVKPVRHQALDQRALLELLLECLAAETKPLTPKTLLQAMPRLRVAVDNCFPGYLAAGMLHRLIRVAQPA